MLLVLKNKCGFAFTCPSIPKTLLLADIKQYPKVEYKAALQAEASSSIQS
jgi:hypothetical protein